MSSSPPFPMPAPGTPAFAMMVLLLANMDPIYAPMAEMAFLGTMDPDPGFPFIGSPPPAPG
jgi:hypothetical protein